MAKVSFFEFHNYNFRYCKDALIHVSIFAQKFVNFDIMEEHLTFGTKLLNGFLRVMVVVLVGILAAVVIAMILAAVGIL